MHQLHCCSNHDRHHAPATPSSRPPSAQSGIEWSTVKFISYLIIVQEAVTHCPHHKPLLGIDAELVLDAIDAVPYRHRLVAPGLSDLSVRQAARKQREYLLFPRGQPVQPVGRLRRPCAESGEHALHHVAVECGTLPLPRRGRYAAASPCRSTSGGSRLRPRPRPPLPHLPPMRPSTSRPLCSGASP